MAQLEAVKEAVATHIGGARFTTRSEAEAWFGGLSELMTDMGKAFASAAGNMEDLPIDPKVVETVRELGHVVGSTSGHAADVFAKHCSAHELWRND